MRANPVFLDFQASNFIDIQGFQFTLDHPGLKFSNVISGALNLKSSNIGSFENRMTMCWYDSRAISVNKNTVLFRLEFIVEKSGELNQILNLTSDITPKLACFVDKKISKQIDLEFFERAVEGEVQNALYQNEPNPFTASTSIDYELEKDGDVRFTFFDVSGKLIYQLNESGTRGMNTLVIHSKSLPTSGIVYYQMEVDDYVQTRKMVIIE